MSTFTWLRSFIGVGIFFGAISSCAFAASKPTFEQEIAVIAERVSLAPRAVQPALQRLQAAHAPLSTQRQALVYEQLSSAKWHSKDFQSALEYGSLLEALGKENNDKSIECLGALYQVYANWKMGKIALAYALVDHAARFPLNTLSAYARVRTLLTTAQKAAEEGYHEEALLAAEQAVQLARASKDSQVLFHSTYTQAAVALAVGNHAVAMKAMNQLLDQAAQSAYLERRIRAKGVEVAVTSYAGMTQRANLAMAERLRLVRELQLDEALTGTLVEYADLQLKSKRYTEAAALSEEALRQSAIFADIRLSNSAHFSHAIANIYSGKIEAGKAEFERLFKSNLEPTQLLSFLPEYAAALTQAGDADASVQAAAVRRKLEFEETLRSAKVAEKASSQLDLLARENQLKALAAPNAHVLPKVWLMVAGSLVAGLIALLYFYRRSRFGTRVFGPTRQAIEIP